MDISLPIALKPLAKLLEKDEPKVLILVGTGVSIGASSASQASWLGLLKHGIDHLVKTGKFTNRWGDELKANLDFAFSPFDLDKALKFAELVEQSLSTPAQPQAFADWLYNSFSDFRPQDGKTDTLDSIQILQQAGALIMTTNYDNLLSDITGLNPVTWEEQIEFLKASRERNKILHVHGHWQRPSSIILGKSSYDRIVKDEKIQSLLRTLWLEWSWVYVGCGDGIDDPNLGVLLKWGKQWGDSALEHYFLAKADKAIALENRSDKPINLVSVPYDDYSDLPKILNSITPVARSWPFTLIDEEFRLFRNLNSSPLNDPFPSRQEYLRSEVPKLEIDDEVSNRLKAHGWAFVLDVASVGKTTLALRIATSAEQRNYPVFYLDLANIDIENASEDVSAALKRLAKQNVLFIFDNAHYQPELVRQLWDQWRDNPHGSKLLIIATQAQHFVTTSPDQDLIFFERHVTNPAVELRPTANDLKNLLNHIYLRVEKYRAIQSKRSKPVILLNPSSATLKSWHNDYGSALGAFCLAILSRISEFERDHWELPLTAAADWVREKWLKNLDAESTQNLLCLAVFSSQGLELRVFREALPYPEKTQTLMSRGFVERVELGRFGQYHQYALREPGWGRLILVTQTPPVNEEDTLFTSASRDARMAIMLSSRLYTKPTSARFENLWLFISQHPDPILQVYSYPLSTFSHLVKVVKVSQQSSFANQLWEAIESDPKKLAELAWETSLDKLGSFLTVAQSHGRDVIPLWEAIESDPKKLAELAWETPLEKLGSFLTVAQSHGRDVIPLWEAIESDPKKLAERAWETPLENLGSFLEIARKHRRDVIPLWEAIESDPKKLAERAWETPLEKLGSFLEIARKHRRDVIPLWEAIESDPKKLAERAWETPLEKLGSFLEIARKHRRDVIPLWEAIESDPKKLAELAWETHLENLGSFLEIARKHRRDVIPLWEAIESDPKKLAELAWETPLEKLGSFLTVAQSHGRDVIPLWEAIESDPKKLAELAWETSLDKLGSLLTVAQSHGRDVIPLWEAIESDPKKLVERAWETSLDKLGSFLTVAKSHGRNVDSLWVAIEGEPSKLIAKAKSSPINELSSFCKRAPDKLVKTLLGEIPPNHWDEVDDSKPLLGSIGLAVRCGEVGREDLKSAIVTKMVKRANWRDYPLGSLLSVVWLITNLSATEAILLPAFLDEVCTKKWLGWQYNQSPCGPLTTGLRRLALYQPAHIRRRFHNIGLDLRLDRELSQFPLVAAQEKSEIIQFLGSASLFGRTISNELLRNIPLDAVCDLPVSVLPHRADATKVEEGQFQLWLGLRIITMVTRKSLPISVPIINQTLDLWRINLAESSINPNAVEHRINEEMVAWLEKSSQSGKGLMHPIN